MNIYQIVLAAVAETFVRDTTRRLAIAAAMEERWQAEILPIIEAERAEDEREAA